MKMLCILLTVASLQIAARGYSQGISITLKNEPLEKLFTAVEQQTNFSFVYSKEAIEQSKPVTIEVKNENLENVLKTVFANQPLSYSFNEKFIIIKLLNQKKEIVTTFIDVRGRVVNENGEPIVGASIVIKGTTIGTSTNNNGEFILNVPSPDMILVITSVNAEPFEVRINARTDLGQISIKTSVKVLDAVVINKGYYSTSQKLNTGSVSKVTAETISKQPVSNPLAALQGRMTGVYIQQTTGVPGGSFNIQIRGQNSIAAGNNPFYVIDGVPYVAKPLGSGFSNLITRQGSPLSSISPADIESIEVLKDADATAIYGSRAANGVILITTKRGRSGKTNVEFNLSTGFGKVARTMDLLNTEQWLEMRKEAFANDGATMTNSNARDLLVWDTTRYTDWQKELIGGTANILNAQSSISGGNSNTQFLISGGYYKETTVFPGDFGYQKISTHFNLTNTSLNQKFKTTFSATYASEKNNLFDQDVTIYSISTPPDAPPIYDANGKLNWGPPGATFTNPFSAFLRKYTANTNNLLGNLLLNYKLFTGLQLRTSLGYNIIQMNDLQTQPSASFNPAILAQVQVASQFGRSSFKSSVVEPQLEYSVSGHRSKLNILIGSTFQQNLSEREDIYATGFTSDALMENIGAAATTYASNNFVEYRYNAFFGRVYYNYNDKYLINLTGRRDGSSRFGPGKQFSNFGAVGMSWIFSNEKFVKKDLALISYGKIRGSYGVVGNDQIADYGYLDLWNPTAAPYQGISGLYPFRLFNPDYGWETNKKLEVALELGFAKDRILFTVNYYRNHSSNQLVGYSLAATTGFSSIQNNLPATVQNTGVEFEINSTIIKTNHLTWQFAANLTIPRNSLLAYPNLSSSSYANTYVVGKPLSIAKAFHYSGVNPQSGLYEFADVNGDGMITWPNDLQDLEKISQNFYGGFQNSINYRHWQLDIFFQFVNQTGYNYLYSIGAAPGMRTSNQPTVVMDRWRKPGDNTNIQRFTQSTGSAGYEAYSNSFYGDNSISDASFVRLENLSLSFLFPDKLMQKAHLQNCKFYVQGQNLLTITNYLGNDPENQGVFVLPPLRVISVGIQLTL